MQGDGRRLPSLGAPALSSDWTPPAHSPRPGGASRWYSMFDVFAILYPRSSILFAVSIRGWIILFVASLRCTLSQVSTGQPPGKLGLTRSPQHGLQMRA